MATRTLRGTLVTVLLATAGALPCTTSGARRGSARALALRGGTDGTRGPVDNLRDSLVKVTWPKLGNNAAGAASAASLRLGSRLPRLALHLSWLWAPVLGWSALEPIERVLMRNAVPMQPRIEDLIDVAAGSVFVPAVGILFAILIAGVFDVRERTLPLLLLVLPPAAPARC